MKKNIRYGVWETNSSLSHSLMIMSEKEYEKLIEMCNDDNYKWDVWDEKWVSTQGLTEEELESWHYRDDYFDEEAEYEVKFYTTEHGDKVVAISYAKAEY